MGVTSAVVEAILDLFEVHGGMVARNTTVVVEHMLSIAPEALDAVDVVAGTAVDERVLVTDHKVLAVALEGLVAAGGIGVVDRTLAGVGLDYDA